MRVAFYGSSLLSAYWNGAATYYRGLLRALAAHGFSIDFYEPDAFDRQRHRDIAPPDWARVHVYPATEEAARGAIAEAWTADVVVKASGVGVFDDLLLEGLLAAARPGALRLFWDVDAAATLDTLRAGGVEQPLRRALPRLDAVFTYGGGPPVVRSYGEFGARHCFPVYNALDPDTHHPARVPHPRFAGDLNFLANRLPDREARVREFFFRAAALLPERVFNLGGNGWDTVPPNVCALGHIGTGEHNLFNCSALAVLNVARDSMAAVGYSPATRVFEAAGAGACLITDAWEGIPLFLTPDEEILVARDGADVAAHLGALSPERARAIGEAGRQRVLREHTYARRGAEVATILRSLAAKKQERVAA